MLDKYKVDSSIRDKSNDIIEKINKEEIYNEFTSSQYYGFIRFMNYIFEQIKILQEKAKVSPYVEIRARIKDMESVIRNYNKDKILDDIFGIEIICATETEILTIKNDLEQIMTSTRSKKHNKPNGYKALHESYHPTGNKEKLNKWNLLSSDVPAVECQFKTIEVELNPEASHHDYKKVNKESIQKKLEDDCLIIGKQLPKMWISTKDGMHELEYKQIIQKVYPFVDITKIKEPEDKILIK